mmetsp:Transcript_23585/g.60556  ORF Transcript_23585/g.60556 Transcript_23585/m.60556 type:complete len:359 (-) Transcript_23585:8342-9418(-)
MPHHLPAHSARQGGRHPRQVGRRAGEVERLLLAQRPVELALEWVQYEVNLIQEHDAAIEEVDDASADANLHAERCLLLARESGGGGDCLVAHQTAEKSRLLLDDAVAFGGVVSGQYVSQLGGFQDQALDACGAGDNHCTGVACSLQLLIQILRDLLLTVKLQGVNGPGEDRGKSLPHHAARKFQQRRRHNLGDARVAIGKQKREQRRDHCGLAGAHDELVAQRIARGVRRHEAPHERNLLLAEDDVAGVLKHEKARIKRHRATGCGRSMVAACGERPCERGGLEEYAFDERICSLGCARAFLRLAEKTDEVQRQADAADAVADPHHCHKAGGSQVQRQLSLLFLQEGVGRLHILRALG